MDNSTDTCMPSPVLSLALGNILLSTSYSGFTTRISHVKIHFDLIFLHACRLTDPFCVLWYTD